MGFERATVRFLQEAKNSGISLARVLTIGRQGLHVTREELRQLMPLPEAELERILTSEKGFCEPLLRQLGAGKIDSLDFSPYEGATILHDMNQPLGAEHHQRFSLVIDGGSLEHVFHYPTALKNCLEAVELGGHFVSITPANNLLGHGFYQISPELFFRVLTPENGYRLTHAVVFETPWDGKNWHQVVDPEEVKSRVELINTKPTYLIAAGQRTSLVPIFGQTPQQSDYASLWTSRDGQQISVEDTRARPVSGWRKLVPDELKRLYRLWKPYRGQYYRRLPE